MKQPLSFSTIGCITLCALLIGGCIKQNNTECSSDEEIVSQFYSGDVLVTISEGAPYETKSTTDNVHYYTVLGQMSASEYSLYVEVDDQQNGFSISKVYSQDCTLLFTEVYFDNRLISREFEDLEGYSDDNIETKASRQKNEGYIACVHRVHSKLKGAMENNYPITCEFISCGAIAAVCAIVECNEYGNDH